MDGSEKERPSLCGGGAWYVGYDKPSFNLLLVVNKQNQLNCVG
jgi:hypothetical protein